MYYCSEFQVIPIKRFLSRALTYIQTYTSKVKTISTPMHYVLGVDNNNKTDFYSAAVSYRGADLARAGGGTGI